MRVKTFVLTGLFLCGWAPLLAAHGDWKSEWERTLAAARQEGVVVVSASSSELLRQALTEFERDYPGMKVQYESGNARSFWARLRKEREVGRYLWDLRVGGVSVQAYEARDRGMLDPILPALVLPEVKDDAKWMGGIKIAFADRDKKYALRYAGSRFAGVAVDREVIPEKDLKTPRDLLDPRWKGRIVLQDPREGSGSGAYALAGFLLQYGEPFVRDLLGKQAPVLSDNKRQIAEWLIRKRYPISIGMGTDTLPQFQRQGLGKNIHVVPGDDITGDAVLLINKAPHPNAAKVYLNWLLSRKTQSRLAQVAQLNSRRVDVPPGNPPLALDPRRIDKYLDVSDEENLHSRLKVRQLAKELLK